MKVFVLFVIVLSLTRTVFSMPLTDVFIATEAEAKSLTTKEQPLAKFRGADIKGVDVVKLEQLLSMVQGRSFDAKLKSFPRVADLSDEGPWILRFAPALEEFFAALDEPQIVAWGERWAQIKEFKLDRFKSSDVIEVVRILVRVSRDARGAKKPLFLWMAL
jgi:hypothetical protein